MVFAINRSFSCRPLFFFFLSSSVNKNKWQLFPPHRNCSHCSLREGLHWAEIRQSVGGKSDAVCLLYTKKPDLGVKSSAFCGSLCTCCNSWREMLRWSIREASISGLSKISGAYQRVAVQYRSRNWATVSVAHCSMLSQLWSSAVDRTWGLRFSQDWWRKYCLLGCDAV
jgi:hypothetical protein